MTGIVMIKGIGTDIIKIDRVKRVISRSGDRLARRILSTTEFSQYLQNKNKAAWLAKRFVAKEAASKALGTGFRQGLRFEHLQVGHNALGKPTIEFIGLACNLAEELGISGTHLSISDEKDYAVAFVVFEG